MKYQISYRVLFTIVFSFTVVFTLRVDAQSIPKNTSSLTWGLGFGSGSYKGLVLNELVLNEYETISGPAPGTVSFTKLAFAFRLLLATNLLDSRLSLGVEYGVQQIREGKKGWESMGYVGSGGQGPDAMIHSVLIIGDYLVGEISDDININAAGGLGVLSFANIDTRMGDVMLLKESDESTVQLAASGRLLVPIHVSSSFTIDPEIRVLASAGKEKLFLVQFLVGLTYRW